MYGLKKIGKVFTSKSVGTGPSSCGKRIYLTAVSQRFRNTVIECTYSELETWHRLGLLMDEIPFRHLCAE